MFFLSCLVVLVRTAGLRTGCACRGSAMSSFSGHSGHTNGGRSPAPDGHDDDAIRQARPVSLIFKRELLKRVPLSFPTIWKMMREGEVGFRARASLAGRALGLKARSISSSPTYPCALIKNDSLKILEHVVDDSICIRNAMFANESFTYLQPI